MRVQITRTGEPLRAVRAAVRPLRCVYGYRVLRQLLCRRECFPARRAHMVLLTGVGPHVRVQVATIDKTLVTQVTDVGSLAGVDPDVVDEARLGAEHLATRIALVLLDRFLGGFGWSSGGTVERRLS